MWEIRGLKSSNWREKKKRKASWMEKGGWEIDEEERKKKPFLDRRKGDRR